MFIEEYSNEDCFEEVGDFLRQCSTSLIYGTPRFMRMIACHLDAVPRWLLCRESGKIIAALPYFIKKGDLGDVYNSLPYYGSNGGVIQIEGDIRSARLLIEHFYDGAKKSGAISATIISNPLESCEPYEFYSRYDCRDERIGQITHLPALDHIESLMSSFSDPRPRNIRKAIKEHVSVVKDSSQEAMNFLFETHASNIKAIGGLSKRKSFFESISSHINERDWDIFVGSIEGRSVAALLLFYHNETVEYFTPVILEEYRSTQALALIIYTAMQDAVARRFKRWNWGGTWLTQGGVYDFKKKWGTTDYSYFYYTKLNDFSLRKRTREELLSSYEGFFVLPFSELEA